MVSMMTMSQHSLKFLVDMSNDTKLRTWNVIKIYDEGDDNDDETVKVESLDN